MDDFEGLINLAIKCINNHQYVDAEHHIKSAMILDMTAAQPHNLFGILLEYKGDKLRAIKHYRAATDLDPTYMPAKNNLYRTGQAFPDANDRIDFGSANNAPSGCSVHNNRKFH